MIDSQDLAAAVSKFDLKYVDKIAASHIDDGTHLLTMRATSGQTVRFLLDAPQVEQLRAALERALLAGMADND